jgi:hypothetical protein
MSTAHSPCAPRALRPEGTLVPLIPPHILAASPLDADAIVPTLYDPEEFAALYHADKDRAIALLAAMTEPQRVRQALASSIARFVKRLQRTCGTIARLVSLPD